MNWNPFEIFMIMSFLYVKKKIQHPFQCDTTKIKSSVSNSQVCYESKKKSKLLFWLLMPYGIATINNHFLLSENYNKVNVFSL